MAKTLHGSVAQKLLQDALAVNPFNESALLALAEIAIEDDRLDRAEAYLSRILEFNRESLDARILPIKTLNGGFSRAKSSQDLSFAYYQSYLVVEYIVERFGFQALKDLIYAYGAPKKVEDIFLSVFHMPLAAFERAQNILLDSLPPESTARKRDEKKMKWAVFFLALASIAATHPGFGQQLTSNRPDAHGDAFTSVRVQYDNAGGGLDDDLARSSRQLRVLIANQHQHYPMDK